MPQTIRDNITKSFTTVQKLDVKDRIEVEVGDKQDASKFHPQMKLMRWDNEANVSFRLDHSFLLGTKESYDEAGGVITWTKKVGNKEWIARFYEDWRTPEGAYKFCELILPERPPVNSISFTCVSKDVDFFYQPALTQQEIDEGAIRPDEVVGSYAIYSKSSGGLNEASGKEYKVGKVGHLYRAKLIDANGDETWADYNTDLNTTGTLTVSVDPTWLDNAVYPVIVDPTFGYTTQGGTTQSIMNNYVYTRYSITESGAVSKLTAYLSATSVSKNAISGTYSAYSLVTNGQAGETSTTVGGAWRDYTYSTQPSLTTGDYELLVTGASAIGTHLARYDSSTQVSHTVSRTYDSSVPSSITSDGQDRQYSIYATYTATGGGATATGSQVSLSGVGES